MNKLEVQLDTIEAEEFVLQRRRRVRRNCCGEWACHAAVVPLYSFDARRVFLGAPAVRCLCMITTYPTVNLRSRLLSPLLHVLAWLTPPSPIVHADRNWGRSTYRDIGCRFPVASPLPPPIVPNSLCACSPHLGSTASSNGVSGHATFDLAVSRPPWRRDGPGCVSASLDRCCSSVALPLCGYSAAHGVRSGSLRCPPAGFVCKRMSVLCCDMCRFIYDLFLGWLVEGKMYLYHRGVRDQRLVCVEIFGVTL